MAGGSESSVNAPAEPREILALGNLPKPRQGMRVRDKMQETQRRKVLQGKLDADVAMNPFAP